MLTLVCCKTGLNRDYVIKGKIEEVLLKNGAEHATQVHGMDVDDIYVGRIPANFLCQTLRLAVASLKVFITTSFVTTGARICHTYLIFVSSICSTCYILSSFYRDKIEF